MIGLLLDGPAGDGSFVDAAVDAARRAQARGVEMDLHFTAPAHPDPRWDAVICHGSAHHDWVLAHQGGACRVVFTDRPDDHELFADTTLVDWAWYEGAACLAAVALTETRPEESLAVLAGPPVLTQRRFVEACVDGIARAEPARPVARHHLAGFRDDDGAAAAWAEIRRLPGAPGLLVTSAGPAGEQIAHVARKEGWRTAGFGHSERGHVARIASDVGGAVERIIDALAAGDPLPPLVVCGLASGLLSVVPGQGASPVLAEVLRAATAEVVRGT